MASDRCRRQPESFLRDLALRGSAASGVPTRAFAKGNNMSVLAKMAFLLSSALLVGCTSAQLEYDRMNGTAFPQPETVAGDEVNFTTIYLQGDLLLGVQENDTAIARLTGPFNPADPNQYDYITTAELETLEAANRSSPVGALEWECNFWIFEGTCTRYHVYGIVVDHYREDDDGTRSTTTLGLMYDSIQRSAFTNYYRNTTVSSDNAKYLRSAAHEAGHAFNLNHCDGDGSTTIMNQTGTVGNNFTYEFSSSSLEHLQDHDRDAVWPGLSSRDYACPHAH